MSKHPATKELEALLPWYVNGQLPADDRQAVEEALDRDARLQQALQQVQAERDALCHMLAARPVPSERMWERLQAQLDTGAAEEEGAQQGQQQQPRTGKAGQAGQGEGLWERGKRFLNALRLPLPQMAPQMVMAGAAVILIVGQAAVIGLLWNRLSDGQTYETASGPADPAGSVAARPGLLVAFQPDVPLARVSDLLQAIGGEIAGGPRGGGFYVIALKRPAPDPAGLEKLAARLRTRSDLVRFVTVAGEDGP